MCRGGNSQQGKEGQCRPRGGGSNGLSVDSQKNPSLEEGDRARGRSAAGNLSLKGKR